MVKAVKISQVFYRCFKRVNKPLVLLIIINSVLLGCSRNHKAVVFGEWKPVAYEGFVEKIFKIADADTINCGFHKLLEGGNVDTYKAGLNCKKKANKNNQSFVFGILRIPIDSYAYEVEIQLSSGQYWSVTYDQMLNAADGVIWVKVCDSMDITGSNYNTKNCSKLTFDDWMKL